MAHNLHVFRLTAENAEAACFIVEDDILDWGNENNWRTVLGAVSRNGEVYIAPGGENGMKFPSSVEEANKLLSRDIAQEIERTKPYFLEAKDHTDSEDGWLWWYNAERYCAIMREISPLKGKPFDVMKHTLFDGEYDEVGLTHLDDEEVPFQETFLVFIDMHS